jgi:hypothetical protein
MTKNTKDKPPDNFFKSVKLPLKPILKHADINLPKITDTVIKAHKIVTHTLQLKLHSYINIKRSEQKMLNRFQQLFGTKEDVIVCFGDYEQKKHMKFKEPIKGKGMRTFFQRNGYKTYLVDEFRTSCMCSNCGDKMGRCEKFLKRKNPRPYRNTTQLVHGLLRCKTCDGVWNRDCNGATNIYRLVKMAILGKKRPKYLSRKLSSTLDDVLLLKKLHLVCA